MSPSQASFTEEQRFEQLWIRLTVGGTALVAWASAVWLLVVQQKAGRAGLLISHEPQILALLLFVVGVCAVLFLTVSRLRVSVEPDGVRIRFWPWKRFIPYGEVARCYARTYRPIREYGGWGVRYGPKAGFAYNVRGDRGVQLELVSGKRIMIGSQHAEELAAAMARHLPDGAMPESGPHPAM